VGSNVLKALIDLNQFNITILTRKEGASLPAGVAVKVVDFSSVESLSTVLKGQDAVIDTTSSMEFQTPLNLINAAAVAGVYRFITSDFGMDPTNPNVASLPVFGRKAASFGEVKAVSEKTGMTWTTVSTGPFLDWNLQNRSFGIDLIDKKIRLPNDGTHVLPWTTLESIGKATAAVLAHPKETENRPVYVSSIEKSQKEVAELAKEALGPDGWQTTTIDVETAFQKAMADFKAGIYNMQTFGPMILYASARKEYSGPWEKDDNALLGVKRMTNEELKALIKDIASTGNK
jgi:uncharacterized protein YbjT (DUF2867 family)